MNFRAFIVICKIAMRLFVINSSWVLLDTRNGDFMPRKLLAKKA